MYKDKWNSIHGDYRKKNWLSQKDKAQYLPMGFDNEGMKQTSPTTIIQWRLL
jgi:hypothetical protein